jgi:hypothetical protein
MTLVERTHGTEPFPFSEPMTSRSSDTGRTFLASNVPDLTHLSLRTLSNSSIVRAAASTEGVSQNGYVPVAGFNSMSPMDDYPSSRTQSPRGDNAS